MATKILNKLHKILSTRRVILGFAAHMIAAFILVLVAYIIFHSYLSVEYISGTTQYYIDPFKTASIEYEESSVYTDILTNEASDVIAYSAYRYIFETDGEFDSKKHINISKYAEYIKPGYVAPFPLEYELEDLIKWGRQGFTYHSRSLSRQEFIYYFGSPLALGNYSISQDGELAFEYKSNAGSKTINVEEYFDITDKTQLEAKPEYASLTAQEKELLGRMLQLGKDKLEDLAYTYLVSNLADYISIIDENDGMVSVVFDTMNFLYDSCDGKRQLSLVVNNWIDYFNLQEALRFAGEYLHENYEKYLLGESLYSEEASNLYYLVRFRDDKGLHSISNLQEYVNSSEDSLTEIFSENIEYLIYFAENLEFSTLTNVKYDLIDKTIRDNNLIFPDDTKVWMYVDSDYTIRDDPLSEMYQIYNSIIRNTKFIVWLCIILSIVWLCIFTYLFTSASADNITFFDNLYTEFFLALVVGLVAFYLWYYDWLKNIAITVFSAHLLVSEWNMEMIVGYIAYGIFGFTLSLSGIVLMSSFVKRTKGGLLTKSSFIYVFVKFMESVYEKSRRHRFMAVRTLIFYNLFLLANIGGVIFIFLQYKHLTLLSIIIGMAIAVFDTVVGGVYFKRNSETREILEGIDKIRQGQVEYQIDISNLSGTNVELAEAVNSIGEGIKNAVDTSVRDEQMKSDLITNVSHDLKTPLTSIINYVDLLQRQGINQEPAKEYLKILSDKSIRLKQLLEDLLEASKLSSGNIELKIDRLNLNELVYQSAGEFEDKFAERNLTLVFKNEKQYYVYADGRRMWRILDNLLGNVNKYAMAGTRVFIDIHQEDKNIVLDVKNVTTGSSDLQGLDLTERFIRGDSSRTTEGSGLGLFIAKSLAQLQGGNLIVGMDGDLFKATLVMPGIINEN